MENNRKGSTEKSGEWKAKTIPVAKESQNAFWCCWLGVGAHLTSSLWQVNSQDSANMSSLEPLVYFSWFLNKQKVFFQSRISTMQGKMKLVLTLWQKCLPIDGESLLPSPAWWFLCCPGSWIQPKCFGFWKIRWRGVYAAVNSEVF